EATSPPPPRRTHAQLVAGDCQLPTGDCYWLLPTGDCYWLLPTAYCLLPTDSRNALYGGRLFDRLVGLRQLQQDQRFDQRPRGIDLARAEAELRAARIAVVVVVQPLAAGDEREGADVGGGVVEVAVADVVAEPVDR